MKNSLLFSLTLIAAGLLFSCSSDSSSTDSLVLEKIVRYTPQFVNFDTKTVTYYDLGNQSVVDSVFNSSNQYLKKTEYITAPLSRTANSYDVSNTLTLRVIEEFDDLGRLITLTSYGATGNVGWKYSYDYDDVDHTIIRNSVSGSTITPLFVYTVNSIGLIYYGDDLTNDIQSELIFDGNKPISVSSVGDPFSPRNVTYYPAPKPSSLRLSDVRKNNLVLKFHLNLMITNSDYYYTSFGDSEHILMTFDGNNYPLTAKRFFTPDVNSWEDFYYYQ